MGYYNVEHPDYYERETEVCDECKEEFLTADGAEFFCHVNGKDHSFCCENCMCNFFILYFHETRMIYAGKLDEMLAEYEIECSHPEIFERDWLEYKTRWQL